MESYPFPYIRGFPIFMVSLYSWFPYFHGFLIFMVSLYSWFPYIHVSLYSWFSYIHGFLIFMVSLLMISCNFKLFSFFPKSLNIKALQSNNNG